MFGRRNTIEEDSDHPLKNPAATLGEILVGEGIVSKGQINEALEKREKEGGFLGQKLVELGYIDQKTLTLFLVKQCKIPHLNLLDYQVSPDVASLVPKDLCRSQSVLPIDQMGKILTVAMVDPLNVAALEAVRKFCPDLRIKPILCDWRHFETVFRKLYPAESAQEKEDDNPSVASFGLPPAAKEKHQHPTTKQDEERAPAGPASPPPAPTPEAQPVAAEASSNQATPATEAIEAIEAIEANPAVAPPRWDELATIMRDSLKDALAPLVALATNTAAPTVQRSGDAPGPIAPAVLGADLIEAVRDAITATQRETAGVLDARFDELIQAITILSSAHGAPAESTSALEARVSDLANAVQQLGQAAQPVQHADAALENSGQLESRISELTNTQLANAQNQPSAPHMKVAPSDVPHALATAVGESVREGLRESLDAIRAALQHQGQPQPLPSSEELGRQLHVLGETIAKLTEASEVLHSAREAERRAVEQAAEEDLKRQAARVQHSVEPFDKDRAPTSENAADDTPVEEALETGAPPLHGFRFDGFFPGKGNDVAFNLCQAVADQPGGEYNPFFLCGSVGVGKTHLLNAIGNRIVEKHPDLRVGYTSASRFSAHIKEALADDTLEIFRKSYSRWDVLILDDIQFLGGQVVAQEEFFHVFNALHQSGRQIVIAGDKPPEKLGLLEKRLVSRFSGGIVTHLNPPEWEARSAILRYHAKEAGVTLPEEVVAMITMRVTTDVRKLVGALRKIVAFAKVKGEDITCEMAGEILAELGIDEAA